MNGCHVSSQSISIDKVYVLIDDKNGPLSV